MAVAPRVGSWTLGAVAPTWRHGRTHACGRQQPHVGSLYTPQKAEPFVGGTAHASRGPSGGEHLAPGLVPLRLHVTSAGHNCARVTAVNGQPLHLQTLPRGHDRGYTPSGTRTQPVAEGADPPTAGDRALSHVPYPPRPTLEVLPPFRGAATVGRALDQAGYSAGGAVPQHPHREGARDDDEVWDTK